MSRRFIFLRENDADHIGRNALETSNTGCIKLNSASRLGIFLHSFGNKKEGLSLFLNEVMTLFPPPLYLSAATTDALKEHE
jgi:hypothetical protein